MEHPKVVGDKTTLAVIAGLRACGYDVLLPFGENTRYDLVIDDGNKLARVQCKTGRLRGGGVRFAVCSCYGHHRNPTTARRDYHGDVDFFGVYCPETMMVYLVPIADLDVRNAATLRVSPSRNSQQRKIRPAERYEVARVSTEAVTSAAAQAQADPC